MLFRALCLLVSLVELSPLIAKEIRPDGIYHPFIISIDRRPEKDISYGKCIALYWNKELYINFLMATSQVGDRECPGEDSLKFDYTEDGKSERIVSQKDRAVSVSLEVEGFRNNVHYKGKTWRFSTLPNRVTVRVPSQSDPETLIDDTFCISYIKNVEETEEKPDRTLIACDDCSSLQKCVDTELPIKKPLRIGGKDVETTPHKKDSERQRSH